MTRYDRGFTLPQLGLVLFCLTLLGLAVAPNLSDSLKCSAMRRQRTQLMAAGIKYLADHGHVAQRVEDLLSELPGDLQTFTNVCSNRPVEFNRRGPGNLAYRPITATSFAIGYYDPGGPLQTLTYVKP